MLSLTGETREFMNPCRAVDMIRSADFDKKTHCRLNLYTSPLVLDASCQNGALSLVEIIEILCFDWLKLK